MNASDEDGREPEFSSFIERYRQGQWRAPIFRDMVLADVQRLRRAGPVTVLDIGCGGGFDSSEKMQGAIASQADTYIGVEPDRLITPPPLFREVHRCFFEDAPIEPDSIDVAFAVMVLEHLPQPARFWDQLHSILRPGGVFWGFTINSRHWFATASLLAGKLRIKDRYLNMLHAAETDEDHYTNYPVFYRSNTPAQIEQLAHAFSARQIVHFQKVGELDYYFPPALRWIGRTADRIGMRLAAAGPILAVRVQK